ncbi:hypothetical protein V8E55_008702 [Tylopilus felleus]
MLFSSTLISTFLLASAVLANPLPKDRLSRLLERSNPIIYNPAYAGAGAASTSVHWVSSEFTVPSISGAEGTSAFVGAIIDGVNDCSHIFSVGVQMMITSEGAYYQAVYQAGIPGRYRIFGPPISAGDQVQVTVAVNPDLQTGSATFRNTITGETWHHSLTSPYQICAKHGLWVVAKISNSIPNFGTLDIHGAARSNVTHFTPHDGSILEIQGQASASISGNTVSVTAQP